MPLIIIMAREFMVSGLRLAAANEGVVVPAGIWGKLKTAFTMVTIVFAIVFAWFSPEAAVYNIIIQTLIWISTALTVISGAQYLKAYWEYIDPSK